MVMMMMMVYGVLHPAPQEMKMEDQLTIHSLDEFKSALIAYLQTIKLKKGTINNLK